MRMWQSKGSQGLFAKAVARLVAARMPTRTMKMAMTVKLKELQRQVALVWTPARMVLLQHPPVGLALSTCR